MPAAVIGSRNADGNGHAHAYENSNRRPQRGIAATTKDVVPVCLEGRCLQRPGSRKRLLSNVYHYYVLDVCCVDLSPAEILLQEKQRSRKAEIIGEP